MIGPRLYAVGAPLRSIGQWSIFAAAPFLATILAALMVSPASSAPFFVGLGNGTSAYDVSGDGNTVLGRIGGGSAFLWTQSAGVEILKDADGSDFRVNEPSLSGDGSVVVYYFDEGYQWTASNGVELLSPASGGTRSLALGVNDDGSAIVGYSEISGIDYATLWTSPTNAQNLGILGTNSPRSLASDVSGDGSVVVGSTSVDVGNRNAFRWTNETGMVALGLGTATAVSRDGKVVVGVDITGPSLAFRWAQASGNVSLGDLPGGINQSVAFGVSADGSVVVGNGEDEEGRNAFIWTEAGGIRSIKDVLANDFGLGSDVNGWNIFHASAVSWDGKVIVGYGVNPDGNSEAWVASLRQSTIPEPTTLAIFGLGLLGLGVARRRKVSARIDGVRALL